MSRFVRLATVVLVLSNTTMRLTFVNDFGQTYSVDIDPDMELENVMALLEAEVSCPLRDWTVRSHASPCNSQEFLLMSRIFHTRDGN